MYYFRPVRQLIYGSGTAPDVSRWRHGLGNFSTLYTLPRALSSPNGYNERRAQARSHHLLRAYADQCLEAGWGPNPDGPLFGRRGGHLGPGYVTQCKICGGRRRSPKIYQFYCRTPQVSCIYYVNIILDFFQPDHPHTHPVLCWRNIWIRMTSIEQLCLA